MVGAPVKPAGQPTPTPQPPAKPRPAATPREGGSKGNGGFGQTLRILISVVIIWHFAGIFLAALSIPVSSPLVMRLAQQPPMQWYLDALYLNHGHSFFAPDIGPGHVIRYELLDPSGRPIEQGELPNRKLDWPRLFYHRHMMLADQAEMPVENKQIGEQWQRKYLRAYGEHLLNVNENAQSVHLQRIAHWPLPRDLAAKGVKLTDPKGYELLIEETVHRKTPVATPAAAPAVPNQSLYWQGNRPNVANRMIGGPR